MPCPGKQAKHATACSQEAAGGAFPAPPIDWLTAPPVGRTTTATGGARAPSGTAFNPGSGASLSEIFAYHATRMATDLRCPLLVFTRYGQMPVLLSHFRAVQPIFAFTGAPQLSVH